MREIKFRAWDKKLNQWVVTGFHIFGETTLFNFIGQHCYETRGDGDSLERYNDIEVTQLTGLHDKNGADIYEGDIITCNNKDDVMGIKWPHKGVVEYVSFRYAINVGRQNIDDEQDYYAWFQYVENIEIIGNIYTHPHLLTSPTPQ